MRVRTAESSASARRNNTEAVLAAARTLTLERGSAFTTQDVINEAGVSLQTFYRCFNGKDRLILSLIEAMIAEHCANLERMTATVGDPVQRLEIYVRATLVPLTDPAAVAAAQFTTSEHWRLQARYPNEMLAAMRPVTELIRRALIAGRDAGALSPRDPDRDAALINTMILGAYHNQAFVPDGEGIHDLASDVWAFCLAAVS